MLAFGNSWFDSLTDLQSSQTSRSIQGNKSSLIPLLIYKALKLLMDMRPWFLRLIPLLIYKALKLINVCSSANLGLIPLLIYKALKQMVSLQHFCRVWFPYWFTKLSNRNYGDVVDGKVWFPYWFTKLSNSVYCLVKYSVVWFPYWFTKLSNWWPL